MKKHLLHFLISVLVLSFVSIACNSDNESSSNENSLVEETAVATVEDEGANENSILQDAREEIVSTNVPTDELSESREAIVPLDNILSEPKRVSFILQETNFEIPDDIMQEIKYFTGGGGGGTVCGYIDAIGWESSSPPKDTNLENQSPTIAKMNTITISTCGWIENEEIVVTLIYPDGRKTSDRFVYPHAEARTVVTHSFSSYRIRYETESSAIRKAFQPLMNDPIGTYTVIFQGETQTLVQTFEVIEEDAPIALLNEDEEWLLYNFLPHDHVRFIAMSEDCRHPGISIGYAIAFCGWIEYEVGSDGSLIVEAPGILESRYILFVLGDKSGPAISYPYLYDEVTSFVGESEYILPLYKTSGEFNSLLMPRTRFKVLSTSYVSPDVMVMLIRFADGVEGLVTGNNVIQSDQNEIDPLTYSTVETSSNLIEYLNNIALIPKRTSPLTTRELEYRTSLSEVEQYSYWIQRKEVSNSEYARCVIAGVCTIPSQTSSATKDSYYNNIDYLDYPVIYVTYFQAEQYCNWWGGRLPTSAEWERAADFTVDPRVSYLFGFIQGGIDEIDQIGNFGYVSSDTMATDSNLESISSIGLLNMNGNVWEWTSSSFDKTTESDFSVEKIVKGGSWRTDFEFINAEIHSRIPDHSYNDVGFRCVAAEHEK